jgi:hypothetical protein
MITQVTSLRHFFSPGTIRPALSLSALRLRALAFKSWLLLLRNLLLMAIVCGLPLVFFPLSFYSLGNDPFPMNVAVVNEEAPKCPQIKGGITVSG